jgi:ribosome-associated protein YbcJ (S4-like RNA binding protein)
MQHTFTLTADYIELNKLLKIFNLVESGSAAKKAITD